MNNNGSFEILNEIIQEKKNDLNNNEIFSYISLMTLLHIVEIFGTDGKIQPKVNGQNLNDLVEKVQGQNMNDNLNNMNMQKMLPLMMNLLGNNNMGNLMSLLGSMGSNQSSNNSNNSGDKSQQDQEEQKEQNEKRYPKKKH